MSRKRALLSFGYWFGAGSLGLLLHPYQSMRRIMREGVYIPLVFLPMVLFMFWWGLGFVISRVAVLESLGLFQVDTLLKSWVF